MKKISIQIKDASLFFKYRIKKLDEPNLLNTNVISNNELVFSDEYIRDNLKIVRLFITDLVRDENIKTIVVSNSDMTLLELNLMILFLMHLVRNLLNVKILRI